MGHTYFVRSVTDTAKNEDKFYLYRLYSNGEEKCEGLLPPASFPSDERNLIKRHDLHLSALDVEVLRGLKSYVYKERGDSLLTE